MRVQIGAIDKSTVNRVGVAAAVVFEWRFAEVGCEGAVGDPAGGLLELRSCK